MAHLFVYSPDYIGLHLKIFYETDELTQEATAENLSVVQTKGERQVNCMPKVLQNQNLRNTESSKTDYSNRTSIVSSPLKRTKSDLNSQV